MKPAIPMTGVALFLVATCSAFAPPTAPSTTPLPPTRLDIKVLPVPAAPTAVLTMPRFPIVIAETDAAAFPMPVTLGRVGHYPIPVISPDGARLLPAPSRRTSPSLVAPYYAVPSK